MNNNIEMELLLNSISELYKTNSNTNYSNIYNYINKNNKEINLINIQSTFYQNKKEYENRGIKIIPYQDYLGIYLPDNDKYIPKILERPNNIKIYLSLEQNRISEVSSKIIEYMYKKKIPALYTIQNYYNDKVISISFINTEDLEIVSNYIKTRLKINNISIGIDGIISYDMVLSKIIERYMKEIDSYDKVNINSLSTFIEDNILSLNKKKKEYIITLYELDSYNELSIEKLQKYQKKMNIKKEQLFTEKEIINVKRKAVRQLLDIMLEIYDNNSDINIIVDELHKNLLSFLKKEDYNFLPEEKSIRDIIKEKIAYNNFKEYLLDIGKETLLKVCNDTKTKYGEEQLKIALLEAQNTGDISSFTNMNGARSELGIVLPKEILIEMVKIENQEVIEL